MTGSGAKWWDNRLAILLLSLLAAIPLLYPAIPPLVDLPSHMGRYAVELAHGTHSPLDRYYNFQWQLVGNLGIDLLIVPLAPLMGLEFAVKCIVLSIPVLTSFALLWIAREAHGRIPPTALFALPLAYNHAFIFGFANFALSMALALLAFALWLRLQRQRRYGLRAALFLVIAPLLWITHVFGWATLCLIAGTSELIDQRARTGSWIRALPAALPHGLVLAPPFLLMMAWRSGGGGLHASGWFDWMSKILSLATTLRDRWLIFDVASIGIVLAVIGATTALVLFGRGRLAFSPTLFACGIVLLALFVIIPHEVFYSAFADMRLAPYGLMLLLIAPRWPEGASRKAGQAVALAGLCFLLVRTTATTTSFAMIAREYDKALGALDHVPVGARLVSFVGRSCAPGGGTNRMEHLPALAMVRRHAFSNDQWDIKGAQPIHVLYPQGSAADRHFGGNPSQLVTAPDCTNFFEKPLNWALTHVPRDKFDYIWIIDPPAFDQRLLRGTTRLWANPPHALYRIDDRQALAKSFIVP